MHNNLSGNVVDLCPVGALADKDFLYQQRVWFLRRRPGVCTGCATGCSIWIEENQDRIYRLKPRENSFVNKWWICNEGRYGYHHVHNPRRLAAPRGKTDGAGLPGELMERLRKAGRLAGVISPFLTVEEAYLLCKLLRSIDRQAPLVLGPAPTAGAEERYPGGFAVAAEKCPNSRGVEEVVAHFARRVDPLERLFPALERNELGGVWVSGGDKTEWIDAATADRFRRLPLLIVQDLFPSPLSQLAAFALPAAAFAEKDGSYVNRHNRLQSAGWAIRPPQGVRPEGELLWEMLGGRGLYRARSVLDEVAREILYFSAAVRPIPDVGLNLKIDLLADGNRGGEGVQG